MATPRIGGAGIGLGLMNQPSNTFSLPAGGTFVVPSGQWLIELGPSSFLQFLDPISGIWRMTDTPPQRYITVSSDGANWRLANLTGCAIGALLTAAGAGYVTAPTVTATAGGSTWQAILGGAVDTSVTITSGGTGYTFPPILQFSSPASGVVATATCTITAGVINTVTVTNQGAGYTSVPTITVIRDPRDTTGTGAVLTPALTGDGTVTAVLCTSQGTPQTTVPTLNFSSGTAAATAIMCFAVTGFAVGASGAGYGNAQPFSVKTSGGITAGTPVYVNPKIQTGLLQPRQADIAGTSSAGGTIQNTPISITDAGLFQAVPNSLVIAGGSGLATTVGQATLSVGGITDTFMMQPV